MPQAPIRRRLVLGASLIACAVPAALQAQTPDAQANGYPQRPIKLLVGIGAGSTTDQLARIAARHLSDVLKQPVVVDNRPGAGGTLGAAAVASAPADGYTLLFTSSSLPTFGYFYDNLKFNPVKDLVGAGSLAQGGMALLTRASSSPTARSAARVPSRMPRRASAALPTCIPSCWRRRPESSCCTFPTRARPPR